MIKPIIFKNQGQQLVGFLHVPDELRKGRKAPGIVMFHGFTGNKTESHRLFVQVARNLCDSGFVVLRFDFRGSGDSDGEFEDMTVPGEVNDAEKALTFLMRQKEVDAERVGVIGLSMGGRVATILSSKDRRIRFVVLYSPALGPLRESFKLKIEKERIKKLNLGEPIRVSDGWYLKKPFFDTLDEPTPLDVVDKIKVPILIIHGDADHDFDLFNNSRRVYEIIKDLDNKNEFYIIKGGDHTFSERSNTLEIINKTREWLISLGLKDKD